MTGARDARAAMRGAGPSLTYLVERDRLRPVLETWRTRLQEQQGIELPVEDMLTDLAPLAAPTRQDGHPWDEIPWEEPTRQEGAHHFGWVPQAQRFVLWEAGRKEPVAWVKVPDALGLISTVAHVLRNQ